MWLDFTQRKFLGLPFKQQHKKCAALLRQVYEQRLQQSPWEAGWAIYLQLQKWMNETCCELLTSEQLADRYHVHQQKAEQGHQEHHLLPAIRTQDRLVGEEAWPLAIYLDHLRSAHNVGSIIRTVEAFRLGTVYFSAMTPFIHHKQVKAAAMGTEQWITCHQGIALNTLPRPLIALETCETAHSLYDFTFPSTFTLILGNEEYGCSREVLAQADEIVEIPLRGRKNSLNVANALAIAAGEINRQKRRLS